MFKITAAEIKFILNNRKKAIEASEFKFWEKQYSKEMPHWTKDYTPSKLAIRFVEEMKKKNLKGKILEIGVGNGRDSIFFAVKKFNTIGIDLIKKPVEMAKKKAKEIDVPVRFLQMDAESLKFKDSVFDGVYSLSVLHSTDVDKSFSEVHRVLKPKGLFLCFMYYATNNLEGEPLEEDHEKLSKTLKITEDLDFNILDLYTNIQEDKVDDEHGEPHVHKIVILLLEKK